ncbi:hypothetical protein L9F63_001887, partial [Diploptera punctata]
MAVLYGVGGRRIAKHCLLLHMIPMRKYNSYIGMSTANKLWSIRVILACSQRSIEGFLAFQLLNLQSRAEQRSMRSSI